MLTLYSSHPTEGPSAATARAVAAGQRQALGDAGDRPGATASAGRAVGLKAGRRQLGPRPGERERRPRRRGPARDRLPRRAQPGRLGDLCARDEQGRPAAGVAGGRPGQPDRGTTALGCRPGALLPVGAALVPAAGARRPGPGASARRSHGGARRGAPGADRRDRRLRARAGRRDRGRGARGRHRAGGGEGPAGRPGLGARPAAPSWPRPSPTRRPTPWCSRSPATATRRSCWRGCERPCRRRPCSPRAAILVGQPMRGGAGFRARAARGGGAGSAARRRRGRRAAHPRPHRERPGGERPPSRRRCGATSRCGSCWTRSGRRSGGGPADRAGVVRAALRPRVRHSPIGTYEVRRNGAAEGLAVALYRLEGDRFELCRTLLLRGDFLRVKRIAIRRASPSRA